MFYHFFPTFERAEPADIKRALDIRYCASSRQLGLLQSQFRLPVGLGNHPPRFAADIIQTTCALEACARTDVRGLRTSQYLVRRTK